MHIEQMRDGIEKNKKKLDEQEAEIGMLVAENAMWALLETKALTLVNTLNHTQTHGKKIWSSVAKAKFIDIRLHP